MTNIYVGNLSFQTTEDELRSAFEEYGDISSVKIVTDRETGRPRGFAFVEMGDATEARSAIDGLNGKDLGGRNLNVSEARPKGSPSGGGDRDRGRGRY